MRAALFASYSNARRGDLVSISCIPIALVDLF